MLDADARREFERSGVQRKPMWQQARTRWENRFAALNDDYAPVPPPASVKTTIDETLFASTALASGEAKGGIVECTRLLARPGTGWDPPLPLPLAVYTTRLNDNLTDTSSELTAALEEKAAGGRDAEGL